MDQIQFDFLNVTDEYLTDKKCYIVNEITTAYNNVSVLNEERTFLNTVIPLINVDDHTHVIINCLDYIKNFHPNESLRDRSMELYAEVEKFLVENSMRKDIYIAFLDYEKNGFCKEKGNLHHEDIRYFEHALRNFRRIGLRVSNLPSKDAEEELVIKKMKKELVELENEFNDNINKVDSEFLFDKNELDGMPLTWFQNNNPYETKNGIPTYKITLKYPDYNPLMEYCKNRDVRKKMYIEYNSRCIDQNIGVFSKILLLRARLARLLGYASHADYKTEIQIVKNSYTALEFQTDLNRLFTPLYKKEQSELLKFAREYEFNNSELEAWDLSFYMRMFKEITCYIDMQEVRSYFPLNTVKNGMFEIYEKLLGLRFEKIPNDNIWHKSVEYYKVTDNESLEIMGYFYLDLHPRSGKFSHAAIFPLQYGANTEQNSYYEDPRSYPVACMACNFPQKEPLSHSDVQTFFHEFGHVMHIICSKTKLASMSSFNVEGDFVEAPSQMLEYWCLNKDALKLMSGKEGTGEKIPDELIDKLTLFSKLLQGHQNKRQLLFGSVDLWYHTAHINDLNDIDVISTYNEAHKNILERDNVKGTCMIASFGHLVGYDAGYYGYLRSETYAANMYYKMFLGHELDPIVGMKYRKQILEPGASYDGITLLENFLGEPTDDKYFLMDKGLAQEDIDSTTKIYE